MKTVFLTKKIHLLQLLLLNLILLLLSVPNVYSQSVVTSNQVAKEGDDEVVIPCNYSQVTNTPLAIVWNEINGTGFRITSGIVNDDKTVNGRYNLTTTLGNSDLVIAGPLRNDTQRRFQCQILTHRGQTKVSDPPSILTVYYLDEPVLTASTVSVYEGKSMNLICRKPDGDPVPSITLYKDGQALSTKDTTRFTTSEDALEIHIEAATANDGGLYMCKAESDPFRGEDGKTSNQIDLKVIYVNITFESKAGTATCTAEGHPEPSSVMILKDGEMVGNGTLTASVEINEEICKSNITCYAENGVVNATEPLKTCKDGSNSALYALFIIPVMLWILFLLYFIFCRKIEMKGEDVTAIEGDESVAMVRKYRPSIARCWTVQWGLGEDKKKLKTHPPKLCSNTTFFFKYILRCCFYFCGICCLEYNEKYENDELEKKGKTSGGKHYEGLEMEDCERGIADGEDDNDRSDLKKERQPLTTETKELDSSKGPQDTSCGMKKIIYADLKLSTSATSHVIHTVETTSYAEIDHGSSGKKKQQGNLSSEKIQYADLDLSQSTTNKIIQTEEQTPYFKIYQGKLVSMEKTSDQSKRDNSIDKPSNQCTADVDGRGTISLTISNAMRSNGGNNKCTIVRHGKSYSHENRLCVHWIEMLQSNEEAEEGDKFEMKCKYGPVDTCILECIWKKFHEDRTPTIISQDSQFETTTDDKGNSSLKILKVTLADAGKYQCAVKLNDGRQVEANRRLVVNKDTVLECLTKKRDAIKGEEVELCWNLLKPLKIESYIFYKNVEIKRDDVENKLKDVENKWEVAAQSGESFCFVYCKALKRDQQFILKISDVQPEDAGSFMLKCSTKNTHDDEIVWHSSTTACLTVDRDETIDMNNVLAFDGDHATLTCFYNLKDKVDVQKWLKKTSKGTEVTLDETETIGQIKKYEVDFDQKFARLKINQVTVADAGVYTCELVSKKRFFSKTRQTSATLVVPLNVFGSGLVYENHRAYRHPVVVLANKNFLVFCEEQVGNNYTRGLLRRGKLMEHNKIEWEPPQTLLDYTNTRFQNLVPIVMDDKKGEIILLCVECPAQQGGGKLIQLKSYNNGETWNYPNDVHLKWPEDIPEYAQLHCIGPGHGLCLKSGKLAVAGFIKFSEQVQLCVIISDSRGATWEIVPVPSSCNPNAGSFGNHAQIVEYTKDQVCITCSLTDCQQRFNVFSSDGCKTFHKAKLEPKLEANPGCQAGIISIPSKMKKGLVAFTNPADECNFKTLSIRLSKDGCETWTDPCPHLIGKFAASSDLAYYEGKDDRGLACVYENINTTEDKKGNECCILMQLISLDEIMQEKSK